MIILQIKEGVTPAGNVKQIHERICEMKESGVIVLPSYLEVIHISEEEKEKVICADDLIYGRDFSSNGLILKEAVKEPEPPKEEKHYCKDCKHFLASKEFEPCILDFKYYYKCRLNHINRRIYVSDKAEACGLFEEKKGK